MQILLQIKKKTNATQKNCKQKLTSFGVFHALSSDFLALDILNFISKFGESKYFLISIK